MPDDPIFLALIFSLLVGIAVLLLVVLAGLRGIGERLRALEAAQLIQPATDLDLWAARAWRDSSLDRAAHQMQAIDPARPWRDIIRNERPQP